MIKGGGRKGENGEKTKKGGKKGGEKTGGKGRKVYIFRLALLVPAAFLMRRRRAD